ncbi:MAG: hypothetical protein LCH77_04960 [Actinobacteria bacterium]|uniref:hypothetical protein n=1 Tax=Nostocoides veronense TaxID=330836 RepID=UPI0031D9B66C|nr:hypothetical protein [Actinomycetota bacterium]
MDLAVATALLHDPVTYETGVLYAVLAILRRVPIRWSAWREAQPGTPPRPAAS